MQDLTRLSRPHPVLPMRGLLLILFAAVLFAASLMHPAPAQAADTLDINSKIHVQVAGEPDVSGDFTIDSSGDITMLYVNQVHVAGLTVPQAKDRIARALAKYYRNPQVVLTLIQQGGITVTVTGKVTTQGPRVVRSDSRLNDVMQAAGPALDANLSQVQVTHGKPGATHTTDTVDYLAFLNDRAAKGNPLLLDSDVIYVPSKEAVPIDINIRGQVAKPNRYSVPAKTTVYDVIESQGGGLTSSADKRRIVIQHANQTQQIPFDYNAARQQQTDPQANPVLLDGDSVIVPSLEAPNIYSITGAVRNPAEYPLNTANLTLADAIGAAGGLLDRARLKDIQIVRTGADGRVQVLKVDATDPKVQGTTLIQPRDNITIPQSAPHSQVDPITLIGVLATLFSIFRR